MSRIKAFIAEHRDVFNNQHPYASHGVEEEKHWVTTVTLTRKKRDGSPVTPLNLSFTLYDWGDDLFEARLCITDSYPDGRPFSSCNRPIGSIEAMTESIRSHLKKWRYPPDCIDKEAPQALLAFVKELQCTLRGTFRVYLKASDYEATFGTD